MTTLWSGLSDGALYALVGVGYNVVLLASGVFNFANAQLIMLGTYLAYFAAVTLKLPLVPTILIGALARPCPAAWIAITFRPAMEWGWWLWSRRGN
jgi:branched-chain amino acid transport system permease protein